MGMSDFYGPAEAEVHRRDPPGAHWINFAMPTCTASADELVGRALGASDDVVLATVRQRARSRRTILTHQWAAGA